MKITRRKFVAGAAVAAAGVAAAVSVPKIFKEKKLKSKVYFTRDISAAGLLKLYAMVNEKIGGKVAIKWHSGEPHGPNIIPVDMVKALQAAVPNSALVETNTLYKGKRFTTKDHKETLKINGWTFCPVDIMDEDGAEMTPVPNGKHFAEMSVGSHQKNYDSMVVLTHFKGHTMGGFGGSMKNIAIGCADGKVGKAMIHCSPEGKGAFDIVGAKLMETMADSAAATIAQMDGRMAYLNVLRNMSVDCDCAGVGAAPVKASDIGILASLDIVAIDRASVDLVYKLPEAEQHDLRERFESRDGLHQFAAMKALGLGSTDYELIEI
ncbi:MAG: DUF362 domain-containing protein [Rickettsiales bacterium]|jgi:uncharacterized Fe-S center protein|nr:DUF362 domain-containing protein [Rickettsiales bacterium]